MSRKVKNLYIKNARWPVTQKLAGLTSSLASLLWLPVTSRICSPSNLASIGSILTSVQTSFNRLAVMLFYLIKWQSVHDSAWFTSNFKPQTHVVGSQSSAQQYLVLMVSRNSCVSQLQTSFLQFSWILLPSCCVISARTESSLSFWFCWRKFLIWLRVFLHFLVDLHSCDPFLYCRDTFWVFVFTVSYVGETVDS